MVTVPAAEADGNVSSFFVCCSSYVAFIVFVIVVVGVVGAKLVLLSECVSDVSLTGTKCKCMFRFSHHCLCLSCHCVCAAHFQLLMLLLWLWLLLMLLLWLGLPEALKVFVLQEEQLKVQMHQIQTDYTHFSTEQVAHILIQLFVCVCVCSLIEFASVSIWCDCNLCSSCYCCCCCRCCGGCCRCLWMYQRLLKQWDIWRT